MFPLLLPLAFAAPPACVTAVYPSADRLPENTLRLYLHFNRPMTRDNVLRHVKLLRADGSEVDYPFLDLDEPLWNDDATRLTLLFDPGRVKRGLKPREEDGPILEEGKRYTLVIDRAWEDADGRPLGSSFRKAFVAGPPDDRPVDLGEWSLMAPAAGTDRPLIVRLARPLDRALLARLVQVTDAAGRPVPGVVTVGGGERVVTFAPEKPWAKGDYKLEADTRLEDVCGNRVGRPFEVDVFRTVTPKVEAKAAGRPFAVR